ncbi:hypothetical protein SPRG_06292 [Saprolegnia parasitica CBS 223.65]|uniref:DUF6604 domain-containing protein n=1 Tax=Saprolegnia parasitica (strain CBS 223.65) TaxID=695850 RepID=A0A067CN75_SAPPC|nr:hypothetical protein SPRG_06292 [Saprolegnia parasitica CBS 223.65]KDO28242.1 hypothetical protein SPRG_06292 [Saprolegnia parasitica CBS 223.65]|eukprot:XP_012201065.1 hypothetical protein SPRG_06292 [Saprolegnia parasitica CBS 223.65]
MAAAGEPSGRWHRYKAATDAFLGWLQRTTAKKHRKEAQATAEAWTTGQIWAAAITVAEAGVPASRCLPHEEGHIYFLNVLRAIQAMLTPLKPPSLIPTTRSGDGLSNVFEALALDDTGDDAAADMPPFDGTKFVPPEAPTPEEAARAARQAQLEADRFHALCSLRDHGETSLVAATAVTNHCIIVAQSLFSELTLELPYIESIECIDVLLGDSDSLRYLVFQQGLPLCDAVEICVLARNIAARDGHAASLPVAQAATLSEKEAMELHAFFMNELSVLVSTRHGRDLMFIHYAFKRPYRDATGDLHCDSTAFEVLSSLFVAKVVPRLAVSVRADALKLVPEIVGVSPFLPVLKVYLDNDIGIAPMMLVFATTCLAQAMSIVDGPGSDHITCASVAATTSAALKQQFKSVLVCRQGRRAEQASASNKADSQLDAFLATVSGSYHATLGVVTKDAQFASDADRARWWLNPYMAGQFLLAGATLLNGAPGHSLLSTAMSDSRLVLHVYNALRVCGHVERVPELEKLVDFFANDKRMWPTGRPTAPGAFTTSYMMTDGAPLETMARMTAITSAPFERASAAFEAATAYREKRDRRNKLQKARGTPTLRKRKTTNATYVDQCRTYRYATRAEPLPQGASLPNLREVRRVVDDEWRRFLHLDLIAVNNILTDLATDMLAIVIQSPPLSINGNREGSRLVKRNVTELLAICDFGVGTAMLPAIATILVAANSKLRDAHLVPIDRWDDQV